MKSRSVNMVFVWFGVLEHQLKTLSVLDMKPSAPLRYTTRRPGKLFSKSYKSINRLRVKIVYALQAAYERLNCIFSCDCC